MVVEGYARGRFASGRLYARKKLRPPAWGGQACPPWLNKEGRNAEGTKKKINEITHASAAQDA